MPNDEKKSNKTSHKIEIFSAGCKFCGNVEAEVKEVIDAGDTLVVHNLSDEGSAEIYYRAAVKYGISSVPSVVVDGELLSCCGSSGFSKDVLSAALS